QFATRDQTLTIATCTTSNSRLRTRAQTRSEFSPRNGRRRDESAKKLHRGTSWNSRSTRTTLHTDQTKLRVPSSTINLTNKKANRCLEADLPMPWRELERSRQRAAQDGARGRCRR